MRIGGQVAGVRPYPAIAEALSRGYPRRSRAVPGTTESGNRPTRYSGRLAFVLLGLSLVAGNLAQAQDQTPAPTITAVAKGEKALTVVWTAPSGVADADITAYDVRRIETDATDKTDANWTLVADAWNGGPLRDWVTRLENDKSYDVQVRAVAGNGSGAWSDTATGTPTDSGGNRNSALELTLDVPSFVQISPGDSSDYFKFDLSAAATLLFFTNGPFVDTVAELQDSSGTQLNQNDQAAFQLVSRRQAEPLGYEGMLSNFFMAQKDLAAGTYYLKVEPFRPNNTSLTIPYAVYVNTVTGGGDSRAGAKRAILDLPLTGRLDSATDADYFRFNLNRKTAVRLYAAAVPIEENIMGGVIESNHIDVEAEITDSAGTAVDAVIHTTPHASHVNDGHPHYGFTTRATLPAGTHYVKISSPGGDTGGYLFYAYADSGPMALDPMDFDPCPAGSQDDPLYGCQWHLDNTGQYPNPAGAAKDINVESVWAGDNLGAGVNIAIVDDGMYWAHDDLVENVSFTRNRNYFDITLGVIDVPNDIFHFDPLSAVLGGTPVAKHGTRVAGIIAARDNDIGVRGVAPRASIYGYNLLFSLNHTVINRVDAMTRNVGDTQVSNNSWGFKDDGWPRLPVMSWETAVTHGTEGGNDVSYVWAGGNGHEKGDNSNLDGRANFHRVLAVCGVNRNDVRNPISERGANLWVCGPTDGYGGPGLTTTENYHKYTGNFGGTSGATPMVSGVLALVRHANEDLTWRDARLVLAGSARRNDSSDSGWETGALRYGSTSERYRFNHQYGFGAVDAAAAVTLADGWVNVPAYRSQTAESADLDIAIPDLPADATRDPVSSTIELGDEVEFVEFVEVNVDFDHTAFRNLEIELESPAGAVSQLLTHAERDPNNADQSQGAFGKRFRFGSARHLGENAEGTWTLRVADAIRESGGRNGAGSIRSWSLTVHGHRYAPGPPEVDTVTGGDKSLTVTWKEPGDTGVTDIVAYDLRHIRSAAMDKADADWTIHDDAWTSGDLRATVSGLWNGTQYDVQVRAVNGNGDGLWSATDTGTTSPGPPAQATGVTLSRRAGALFVSWDEVPNATGYRIQWKSGSETFEDAAADNREASVSGSAMTSYRIGGLDPATTYAVRVISTNAEGTGPVSGSAEAMPAALPLVSIAAVATPVFEAAGAAATFALTRDSVVVEALTVTVQIDETGSLIAGAAPGTVTFAAGQATAELSVPLADDGVREFDGSTVTATVVAGTDYRVSATAGSAGVRALDDDALFQARFDSTATAVDEHAGSVRIGVTVRTAVGAPAPAAGTGGIAVSAGAITAGNPEDYGDFGSAVVGGAIEFQAGDFNSVEQGQRVARQTVAVAIENDRIDETDETFAVRLALPAILTDPPILVFGADNHPSFTETEVTIADNDAAPSLSLSVDRTSIAENGGSSTVSVSTGSGSTFATAQAVTLRLDGTATEASDYRIDAKGLTLPAGAGSNAASVATTVRGVDDDIYEGSETIRIAGSRGGTDFGTERSIAIADDDTRSTAVNLAVDPLQVREDVAAASVTVKAALNEAPFAADTTVDVTVGADSDTAKEGADYAALDDFDLTIDAGETSAEQTVSLEPASDGIAEGDESITVSGTASGLQVNGATLTINDADTASTGLALTLAPGAVGEGGGARTVTVTATLNGGARTEDTAVTIEVGRSADSAIEGDDYAAVDDRTLTIAAGQPSGEARFTVHPVGDVTAEGDETITVDGDASGLTVTSTTLTLTDDDAVSSVASLFLAPAAVVENAGVVPITVRAQLDAGARPTDTTLSLSVGGSGDTAVAGTDYARVSAPRLTIDTGETLGEATFDLRPTDDGTAEGTERITVTGSTSGLSVTEATLSLADDDTVSRTVTLAASPSSVAEDGGRTRVRVTATLNAAARPAATEVPLRVGAPGDTAVAGSDYARVPDFTLTIPADAASGEASFDLDSTDDETAAGERLLSIVVRTPLDSLSVQPPGGARIAIQDDDAPAIRLTPESLTVDEGAMDTYTVALGTAPTADVTVTVTGASGDVGIDPESLEFTGDDWSGPQTVTVDAAHDDDARRDPDVRLVHRATGAAEYAGLQATLVVAVREDEEALLFSARSLSVSEGGTATYTVALADQPTGRVAVAVTGVSGDLGLDRDSLEFTTGDWDGPQSIEVSAAEDDDTATDPAVTLIHTASGGGLDGVEGEVSVTIAENDRPPPPPGGGSGGGSANRPPVIEREIEPQTLAVGDVLELDVSRHFYDRERRVTYFVEAADPRIADVEVDRNGVVTIRGIARGVTAVTVTVADHRDERVSQAFAVTVEGPALLPLFPSASDPVREGFARVINHSAEAGEIAIAAIDDQGKKVGPVVLTIDGNTVAHFNSGDLEGGNPAKGLQEGVGSGDGDWRLVLESETEFEVLSYIRTAHGFLTAMHDTAPVRDGAWRVSTFNPASNPNQVSSLRVINPGSKEVAVRVTGVDDAGASPGTEVEFAIAAGESMTLTASDLELGTGVQGALGDGRGKWRLTVETDQPIVVMSLLSSPGDHLTNLSSAPGRRGERGRKR